MRWILAATLLIAGQDADDPYAITKKAREKMASAKSVTIEIENAFATTTLKLKGKRFSIECSGGQLGKERISVVCDGRAVVGDGAFGSSSTAVEDFPLNPMLSFTQPVFFAIVPAKQLPPQMKTGDSYLRYGAREKRRDRDCHRIDYVHVSEEKVTIKGATWFDVESLLPVEQEVTFNEQKLTESYKVTLDAEIADSVFALQSKARLTRALAAQLARSAALYETYRGVRPETLDDLVRKPASGFWPAGGFFLRTIPRDGWGGPFTIADGTIRSHGADGKPGGTGDDEDIVATVAPAAGWKIEPPTDRLRDVYTARVHVQLLTAAVTAYRSSCRVFPKSLAELQSRSAKAEFWPEGGFAASLPRDAGGKEFRFVATPDLARIFCDGVKRLKPSELTKEETAKLAAAAPVPLTSDEIAALDKLVARLGDDDLEARESAARSLELMGARAAAEISKRADAARDKDLVARLRAVRSRIVVPPPTWQSELGSLKGVAGHGGRMGPARETSCLNNLSQLYKMQFNYMVQFGGAGKLMPKDTGPDFWLALTRTTPSLIDETLKDIFTCPGSDEEPGVCTYWGPKENINGDTYGDGDPVGMCDDPSHGDHVIILRKSADVLIVKRDDPLYKRALELLKGRDDE